MKKNNVTKKAEVVAKMVKAESKPSVKTSMVLKMVEQGKNRKDILDALCKLDPDVSRKSNAGLVSHIFKANGLLGKVESGVIHQKKVVAVKATKKASEKKAV